MRREEKEMREKLATLNGLAGNFAATLLPETARLWLFLLRDYPAARVQAAALALIRRYGTDQVPYHTMPPFVFMQKALDDMEGAGSARLQARDGWMALLEAARQRGSWRDPELDPVTALVVRALGGWDRVCGWKTEELPFRERDFLELWDEIQGREDLPALGCKETACLAGPMALADLVRALPLAGEGREGGKGGVPAR